jgi:hypothetical protein
LLRLSAMVPNQFTPRKSDARFEFCPSW